MAIALCLGLESEDDRESTAQVESNEHFLDDEVVHQKLTSPIDTPHFWSQKVVLDELQRLTLHALTTSSDGADQGSRPTRGEIDNKGSHLSPYKANSEQTVLPSRVEVAPRKPGRFSRLLNMVKPPSDVDRDLATQPVKKTVHVKVESSDICIRTTNAFGLYETRTQDAVIVTIDLEYAG